MSNKILEKNALKINKKDSGDPMHVNCTSPRYDKIIIKSNLIL